MTRAHLAWVGTLLTMAGGFTLASSACGVAELDLNGHPCPCGAGFVCDTTRNLCVPPGGVVTVDSGVHAEAGVPAEAAAPPCLGENCACTTAGDCKDPTYPKCVGSKCVECTSGPDTCAALSYCLPSNQCAPGCKSDAECAAVSTAAPFCNVARHQCVNCAKDADCTGGLKCSPSGACVTACSGTCTGGKACCNGLCLDTTSDPLNCNACGAACTGTQTACCAGACTDPLVTATNCGQCGTSCSTTNGSSPSCQAGSCRLSCNSGFSHCVTGNTGCETNTSNSVTQCGSCYRDCTRSVYHANGPACVASACTYATCIAPYMDCDMSKTNGCECTSPTCGANGQVCCAGNMCNPGTDCEPAPAGDGKCHS